MQKVRRLNTRTLRILPSNSHFGGVTHKSTHLRIAYCQRTEPCTQAQHTAIPLYARSNTLNRKSKFIAVMLQICRRAQPQNVTFKCALFILLATCQQREQKPKNKIAVISSNNSNKKIKFK